MVHLGTKQLETEQLLLRRLTLDDASPLYHGLRNQPEFLYYTNKKEISLNEQIELFEKLEEKYKEKTYYNWAIVLKSTGEIVGMINFKVNDFNDSVEFNYATDNRHTNKGYMTEALKCVTNFALNELNVNRIQGGCVATNLASKRVIEKCGYTFEGTLKSYIKLSDGYHDMKMFSIVNNGG